MQAPVVWFGPETGPAVVPVAASAGIGRDKALTELQLSRSLFSAPACCTLLKQITPVLTQLILTQLILTSQVGRSRFS